MLVHADQNALDVHRALLECNVYCKGASTDVLRMKFHHSFGDELC